MEVRLELVCDTLGLRNLFHLVPTYDRVEIVNAGCGAIWNRRGIGFRL